MLPDGFLSFINEHQLFGPADRVLLAVSGGIDSVVLVRLMQQAGFTFGIAHVNFGLRGADSDADAAFVQNMAHHYGVPFHVTRFDTLTEASLRHESTQVTARQLRYNWFREIQLQYGYVAVATAHHLNDVLETILLNLIRGTGLSGLRGMPIQSELSETGPHLVRPLWFATRSAIEVYAEQHELDWREDASNALDKYSRNKIRHQVVPVLEQINPGLLRALPRSLSQLRAAETILQNDIVASFQRCISPISNGFIIDLSALVSYPEPLFRLGEWLRPYGFTPDVLAQCWHAVDPNRHVPGQIGQVFLAPEYRLLHDRQQLWLLPRQVTPVLSVHLTDWPTSPVDLASDGQLTIRVINRTDWDQKWPTDSNTALFDADSLPFPWTLRRWCEGDRFVPLGMNGSRLVSDFLADTKLGLPLRERVRVLECNGRIMWVVGMRIAQTARITQKTRRICCVEGLKF
ncbi:tRNA lysidine(34) synthetase TilS [Fibrella aquatica]|uniref:tRNA lysidine(34) synthetase TilS n=1 Tax=Fibrella aquatica TaxID=3242487 RepID=UPI003521FC56